MTSPSLIPHLRSCLTSFPATKPGPGAQGYPPRNLALTAVPHGFSHICWNVPLGMDILEIFQAAQQGSFMGMNILWDRVLCVGVSHTWGQQWYIMSGFPQVGASCHVLRKHLSMHLHCLELTVSANRRHLQPETWK